MPEAPELSLFGRLPDEAVISMKTLVQLTELGETSLWALAKKDPRLKPIKFGARVTRFRVSGVRKFLAGEQL